MIHRHSPRIDPAANDRREVSIGRHWFKPSGDGYDAAGFIADLRKACVTSHVAQTSRHSAIDARTTRHKGYALSIQHRKRIEEVFG